MMASLISAFFGNNRDPCSQKGMQYKGLNGQGHLLRFSGPAWPSLFHLPVVGEYDSIFQNAGLLEFLPEFCSVALLSVCAFSSVPANKFLELKQKIFFLGILCQ